MQKTIKRLRDGAVLALIFLAAWTGWSAPATTTTKATARPAGGGLAQATSETIVTGALIWLDSDSPYYAAGLRSRDMITKGNGQPILNDGDFYKVFAATTNTAQIQVEGLRDGKPFRATVPSVLPPDVSVGSYKWDWFRFMKHYATPGVAPDARLARAYESFDLRQYPQAQLVFTSATKAGQQDPLTLTKLAWLLLSRRTPTDSKAGVETAGKWLEKALQNFDASVGDKETQSKLEGTYMIYCQAMGNTTQAAIHGRRAIALAPHIIGNRINYYTMLSEAKTYDEAMVAADALAADYPRSVYFQRLKKAANQRVDRMKGVIEASEALVNLMPDDIPTRLQLLPFLDRIADNYSIMIHCELLLGTKASALTDAQKATIKYYEAQVNYRRHSYRAAESLAREAIRLRGSGEDFFLLASIMHDRHKWKDAVIAYNDAQSKSWTTVARRDMVRELRDKMDDSIDHLWSWQIKSFPATLQPMIRKRKQWLDERAVLKHSFVMRNRYGIRNALIGVGVIFILSGLVMRFVMSND
jgi:tetratricopeptide (TPR) repeat protein